MIAEEYLKSYINKSRPFLDLFFEKRLFDSSKISPIASQMVTIYKKFMGGKNLRGALTYYSYKMFGGKSEEDILRASTIVEITHAFLLMHDDIMDQDALRRGQPTIHKQYEDIFKKRFPYNNRRTPEHFGTSLAINVGDLGPYFSNLILLDTHFDSNRKLDFLKILSETIITVAYGQSLDMFYESDLNPTLPKILRVHQFKTANYTINGPLKYGAVLAGLDTGLPHFKALDLYGTPVGIAFQLRDDELGMFSTEEELGKPADSDLKEGKNTLLFQKAFEKGTHEQVKFLKYAHGNHDISKADTNKVRQIIVDCGALEFSKKMGRRLVEKGKQYIPQITPDGKYQELLRITADYVIERNN